MKLINKYISLALLSGAMMSSCSDSFLQKDSLTESSSSTFWQTSNDAMMALAACYDALQSNQLYNSDQYTFGQWIYTIARNTFIDYVRRKRDDTVSIDNLREAGGLSTWNEPNPEERMITHQNRARIEAFLDRMSPRYKELIELRFFKEYSYEEIASHLNLPMGTVKTQIHRAREQLCRFILKDGE